ncbi:MAG: acyl-CoA dehydrogenase family protein [Anaerolineales bacterium]|jgi:alkylation response protein AidB-like acyl-CoA dehydrogenase
MYGFEPSEEQRMLMDAAERFATNQLRAAGRESDESGELPQALIEKGWELGVLQASIPEAYGGFGEHSAVTGALAAEAMAWGDLSGTLAVMAPTSYVIPILLGGTEEQKKTLIPPVIEDEWKPYVAAYVEPVFDFHEGDMQTTAEAKKGGFQLNGVKTMVPFADRAEAFLVFAMLDGTLRAFSVPAGTSGLTIGEREPLLGLRALPTYRLTLENVALDQDALIGGSEEFNASRIVASSQVAIAAMAIGLSKGALDYALPYAKEREVWGVPIAQKQSIAFMLAEMAIEIESNRLLVWEAAWKLDEGDPDAPQAAYLAFSGAADTAMMVTDRAVQTLGGHGYVREHPVEMWMRNGRGIPIMPGLAMV